MTPNEIRARRLAAALTLLALIPGPVFLPGCASVSRGPASPPADEGARAGAAVAERPVHPGDLKFPEQEFEFRRTERVVLSNGMVLHLLEDHTLPIVDGSAYFRGGSVFDPDGKEGLASLACGMVRQGGTVNLPPAKLDEELDFIAGSVGVGAGDEECTAGFSFMSKDLDQGLALFADVLRDPAFDEQRFAAVRMSALRGLQQALSTPGGVLSRAFSRVAYDGHPYGRLTTMASLQGITVEDLRAYHAKWFHPESFILAVAGDFRKEELVAKLEKAFAGWEKSPEPLPKHPPEFERKYEGSHSVVHLPGNTQSNVRMGHWGPKRNTPERVQCDVMNYILGGGSFSSRMTRIVRTKEGLAYSVWSFFSRGSQGGLYQASVETNPGTTYRALSLMKSLMEQMRQEPVSEEDLALAKEAIVNGFIRIFENPGSLASQYASLEFSEYPPDWLQRYLGIVRSVTVEDVQAMAREYLRPDALDIVIVGNAEALDAPPEDLGAAERLPIQ